MLSTGHPVAPESAKGALIPRRAGAGGDGPRRHGWVVAPQEGYVEPLERMKYLGFFRTNFLANPGILSFMVKHLFLLFLPSSTFFPS
jgi:hypothetical protein